MEVFLVPVGADRYELYSETSHEGIRPGDEGLSSGFWKRQIQRFHIVLDRVEREQHRPPPPPDPDAGPVARAMQRVKRRAVRWLAEKVAEQRLLWQLRGRTEATAVVPADLDPEPSLAHIHRMLHAEARRHGRWLIVNAVLLVLSAIVAPIPGPNLIAYYFAFRVVGHYLARRGATAGTGRVRWDIQASDALVELRRAFVLDPVSRDGVVHAVASSLRLQHLAAFFRRVAVPTA